MSSSETRMAFVLVTVASVVAGCSVGPRQYHYDIDVVNRTDRTVTVEFLRGSGSSVGKVRVDLAPGGAYVSRYTVYGADYLEARMRFMDDPDAERFYLQELGDGPTRRDIVIVDGGLNLARRPMAEVVSNAPTP